MPQRFLSVKVNACVGRLGCLGWFEQEGGACMMGGINECVGMLGL